MLQDHRPEKTNIIKELCILLYFCQKQIPRNVPPGVELMTRDEQTFRIFFVRLRKTGKVFHLSNAREYIARHIVFTYKYRARAMRRPRVKGGVVKVSGVPCCVFIWRVCIYNTARRQVYLSVVFMRNFQPLQVLQAL